MGLVHVDAEISPNGGPWQRVRLLVDSGAEYSVIPLRIWRKLGLRPKRPIEFVLADGSVIRRRVSECRFRLRGVDAMSPVVLGQEGDDPLLGAVTLETLGLVLNLLQRRLRRMRLRLPGLNPKGGNR